MTRQTILKSQNKFLHPSKLPLEGFFLNKIKSIYILYRFYYF
nr:MAG TPA: hypothetical protein [Caudoviricetes sp.]